MPSIKDREKELESRSLTVEEYKEMDRQAAKRRTTNITQLYGFVSAKVLGEARPRMDKKTNLPICDDEGNQLYYKQSMSIKFDITGGSLMLQTENQALFDSVDEFESYLLTARHGEVRAFGRVETALIPLKFEI